LYTYTDAEDAQGNRLFPSDVQAFIEGKAAMMFGYGYQVKNIRTFNPRLKFDTAPLPQRQLQNPVTLSNYWGETVSKTSKHPNEAWDFIAFAAGRSNQNTYFRTTGNVPSHQGLLDNLTSRRYYGAIATQIPYAESWYRKNTAEVETIFARMIDNVLKNRISPSIAIDTAVRDINNLRE
jgi:ABC-type glycerol-3-phosphate transport system substrate-binding protein